MNSNENPYIEIIVKSVIAFLKLLMCETLAKRIVSMMLYVAGIPNTRITELTGLCDKSVRTMIKSIKSGEHEPLFHVGNGGHKKKLSDYELDIVNEINNDDYQSQQQIADMIL
jgi:transposase